MTKKFIVKGGCVLTLGSRTQNYPRADVLIDEGNVAEVGTDLRARGAEVIDATDTIVMPGFVDTHRHAWRSLFRNFGEGPAGSLQEVSPQSYGPHHGPEDIYAATLVGLLGAIESGITTVVDWADVPSGDDFASAVRQAHADAGLRTVLVRSTPSWETGMAHRAMATDNLAGSDAGLTTIAAGPGNPADADIEDVAREWGAARDLGFRIHVHVGMAASERGIVAELGKRGLLGDDVTLVHCSHLGGEDLDAIASSGARVSLSPSSEMAAGLGAPPIQMLIDRGVRPGLGVDDERVAPGDMFAQMRATNSIQHATVFDLKLAGKAGLPTLLTTREVIRYSTIDGANASGLGSKTGSIEPGKSADIIVLRADRPNIAPINDPIGAVVWGMDTSNLDWVFVNGEPLMRDGALVADVANARQLASGALQRVAAAVGFLAGTGSHL